MSRRQHTALSVAWGLALYVAHHHVWRDDPAAPRLLLGWMPVELAWRLGWMALAALFLAHLCARVWRAEDAA